ncbi:MAG: DUF1800 domain-containing protein [Armatimonadota bacterium]|nr:DUF1800 domain-containing protein [Armatimonadota bacterium]
MNDSDPSPASLSRREWLRIGALAGTGALLSGCSKVIQRYTAPKLPGSVALPAGETEPITRLINRVSFGPTPGEVERVAALGAERYVDEQLNADNGRETSFKLGQLLDPVQSAKAALKRRDGEDLNLSLRLRSLEVPHGDTMDLRNLKEREVLMQLQQAAILRAVYSRHQLRERLVDFWSNHFNIYAREGFRTYYKPADERSVIRQHALGSFPELLRASAHSPAMLFYLNNEANRRGVPNENYARELMELHSLGVHGGYTQKDVLEVARCFTGWRVEERFLKRRGTFFFDPSRHDDGPKTVLGVKIPAGGGQKDADKVLDILARHPSTARFISGKLCRYFLGDAATTWTEKMAAIYLKTNGNIKAMLRPMLLSPELLHSPPILKRPFDFLISALRALNADTDGSIPLQQHLARMGQPLYQWPMPDGYPDKTAAWTGSLLARWNFAFALTAGSIKGTALDLPGLMRVAHATTDAQCTAALIEIVLSRRAEADALRPLHDKLLAHCGRVPRYGNKTRSVVAEAAALLLAAPEFQWR